MLETMMMPTSLFACLLSIGLCATTSASEPSVLACNLKAISSAERPRYNELIKRVRAAVRHRDELPDGYALRLDSKGVTLSEVGEWVAMERLCCPFLTFQLEASGSHIDWTLKLAGPQGAKQLLRFEFGG
jgi:hypothetical protein